MEVIFLQYSKSLIVQYTADGEYKGVKGCVIIDIFTSKMKKQKQKKCSDTYVMKNYQNFTSGSVILLHFFYLGWVHLSIYSVF